MHILRTALNLKVQNKEQKNVLKQKNFNLQQGILRPMDTMCVPLNFKM